MALNAENCLQKRIGSCAGCENLVRANDRVSRGENPSTVATEIEKDLCLDGVNLQRHLVTRRRQQPVW